MIFFFLAVIALHFVSDWVISTFAYKPVFAPHLLTLKTFALLLGWISLAILWVRKYHTCHVRAVGGCEMLTFLSCFKLQEVMQGSGLREWGMKESFSFLSPIMCPSCCVPQCYWGTSMLSAGHPWTDLSSLHCIWQFNLAQDFHSCFKPRVWSYKALRLGLCWEFRSDYPRPLNCIMGGWYHSHSSVQRPRGASCCLQWEPCMGRDGMGSSAPAVPVARNHSSCNWRSLEQPYHEGKHQCRYCPIICLQNQSKLPFIPGEVEGMILGLKWKSYSNVRFFFTIDAN